MAVAGGVAAVLAGGAPASALVAPGDSGAAVTTAAAAPDAGKYVTINFDGGCLAAASATAQVEWKACAAPAASKDFLNQVWQVGPGSALPRNLDDFGKVSLQNVGARLKEKSEAKGPGVSAYKDNPWTWLGTNVVNTVPVPSMRLDAEAWSWRTNTVNADGNGEFGLWTNNACKRFYLLDHGRPFTYLYASTIPIAQSICSDDSAGYPPPRSALNKAQKYRWTEVLATTVATQTDKYVEAFDAAAADATLAPATVSNVSVSPVLAAYGNNRVSASWNIKAGVPGLPFTGTVRKDILIVINVNVSSWAAPLQRTWPDQADRLYRRNVLYTFPGVRYACGTTLVSKDIFTSAATHRPDNYSDSYVDTAVVKARLTVATTPRCNVVVRLVSPVP